MPHPVASTAPLAAPIVPTNGSCAAPAYPPPAGDTTVMSFIKENWWGPLSQSAFKNKDLDYLFERSWFDESDNLDINDPRYGPIVSLLIYTHASLNEKIGVLGPEICKPAWKFNQGKGARVTFIIQPKQGSGWTYIARMPARGYIDRRADRSQYLKSLESPGDQVSHGEYTEHGKESKPTWANYACQIQGTRLQPPTKCLEHVRNAANTPTGDAVRGDDDNNNDGEDEELTPRPGNPSPKAAQGEDYEIVSESDADLNSQDEEAYRKSKYRAFDGKRKLWSVPLW